jgi:hypothetical protein
VMPGVRLLGRFETSAEWKRVRGRLHRGVLAVLPAMMDGLTSAQPSSAGGMAQVASCLDLAGWREVG